VLAVHALLLLGLSWPQSGGDTLLVDNTLITRVIAPPPQTEPPPETKPPPQAEQLPKVEQQPQVEPQPQPKPKPRPKPKPKPSPAATPPPEASAVSADSGPSMLAPPPRAVFGGTTPPAAIDLPLSPEDAGKVVAIAGAISSAPVRLPRPATLGYRATGMVSGVPFAELPTTLKWRNDGNYFDVRWSLYSPKIGEQTRMSTGLIVPAGLLPVLASLRTPQTHEMRFDYQNMQLSLSDLPAAAPEPQAAASDPQAAASQPQATASQPQAAASAPQAAASQPQTAASASQAAASQPQEAASEPQAVASEFQAAASEPQAAASEPQAALPTLIPGAQDRLSALLQVAALVAGDRARYSQPGASIDLPAVHPDRIGQWHFVVQGPESVQALNDQTLATLHLTHAPQDAQDAQIDLWLAPRLDYLPARVRVTEAGGDTIEYTVRTATTQPTPMAAPPVPPAPPAPPDPQPGAS
jgi:outer membrane biosynthesis protein TonB